uniref:Uncharacterized protein n=1 Tax=Siphoviridae sp. ctxYv12 TaxID=2827974 RepID=A0A8S5S3Z9_9CAUD|nr:MAG TPA: hypothetical protein [Siphoviridae sp. ctxYv12]
MFAPFIFNVVCQQFGSCSLSCTIPKTRIIFYNHKNYLKIITLLCNKKEELLYSS